MTASDVADERALMRDIDHYLDGKFDFEPGPDRTRPAEAKEPVWGLATDFVDLVLAGKDADALKLTVPDFERTHRRGTIREAGITGPKFAVVLINDYRIAVVSAKLDLAAEFPDNRKHVAHVALRLKRHPDRSCQVSGLDVHYRSENRLRDEEPVKPLLELYLRGAYNTD